MARTDPRRLLVTGGAGFIGTNFVYHWIRSHPLDRLFVLDVLTYAGNPENLRSLQGCEGFSFVQGDIGDAALVERLLREEALDTIVHFAAESHVDRSIDDPGRFVTTNVLGTQVLLESARRVWLPGRVPHRFHHVSTDEVYGSLGPDAPPFTEATPYSPNSPYAASKAAADHLVRAYHHTYGLETTISNCSNNYGPYQYPEKLIPLLIISCLHGQRLPIYGDGLNVRDWLYVGDHVRGVELVLQTGAVGGVYNIGARNEQPNIRVVRLLCRLIDDAFAQRRELAERYPQAPPGRGGRCEELISYVRDRPGHDRRYALDASRIETELGYRALEAFETGLERTVAWYLQHEAWWQPLARANGDRLNRATVREPR